jgi:O-antigen ligase
MYASLLWTNALFYGMQKVILVSVTIFIFYLIFPILKRNFLFFIKVNIIFFIIYLINLYVQYGFFEQLSDMLNVRFRLGWDDEGSALNPIGIARYLLYGYINIGFYFLITKNSNKDNVLLRYILVIPIIVGGIYIFFTGTKAPLLAFIVSVLLYVFINKYISRKFKIILLIIPVVIYLLFTNMSLFNQNNLTSSQQEYIEYRYLNADAAFSDRAMQNERALTKINGSIVLFGAGSGDFGYLYTGKDIRDYPHNILSEVLYENGIINLIILLAFFVYILNLSRNNKSYISAFFIISFNYFFINALFSGDLITNNLVFGFITCIIIISHQKFDQQIEGK